jgi:hypothetical protein
MCRRYSRCVALSHNKQEPQRTVERMETRTIVRHGPNNKNGCRVVELVGLWVFGAWSIGSVRAADLHVREEFFLEDLDQLVEHLT